MPVYLCQPGSGQSEPWRYGIQVYSGPFKIDETSNRRGGRDLVVATWMPDTQDSRQHNKVVPIRRVRHAEVVLVDDVCVAYDRYWLRLRWPGHKGGFAGYIAMGLVSEAKLKNFGLRSDSPKILQLESNIDERGIAEDADMDDPMQEERQETGSRVSEPVESTSLTLTCLRSGLVFQSSQAMKLLATYDDGVSPPVAVTPFTPEPVFCRICREGLHDDADEEQPAPTAEDGGDDDRGQDPSTHSLGEDDIMEVDAVGRQAEGESKGPVVPHPPYSVNSEALQNPFLAPCECSGSMAFVHYLCVEQWRCRSRHPEAHNGLNCETCGAPYSLPPPSERPAQVHALDQEDWLEAMPPHVMQALRRPHICWQIGAAIVRRRWLRPLAPIIMSPVVALYCRARRLLKKRGVARRRWACSLCRRRARWKCVRCLRSYYCSRQCQNVSWHIVHKHVCYKPARFWGSVALYCALTVALFPGILRDPIMYDLGFFLIPLNFIIMGIIGGGGALLMKKAAAVDFRGRPLEFVVVLCTLCLSMITWGLVKGFFGDSSACIGAFGGFQITGDDLPGWYLLRALHFFVLRPGEMYYRLLDLLPHRLGNYWLKTALCTKSRGPGCFEHLPHANANFFLAEGGGKGCAADLQAISWLYLLAGATYAGSALWKHHDRQRRRQGRRPVRVEARPHQD